VGQYGETIVLDWGEAARLDLTGHTAIETKNPARDHKKSEPLPAVKGGGSNISVGGGTLCYMAPERFQDRTVTVGRELDTYSLGVCLYKALTSREPFCEGAKSETDVILKIVNGKYTPVKLAASWVPSPLAAVCEKAISKDCEDRFLDARGFGKELERFLDDTPVHCYSEKPWETLSRRVRRSPALVVSLLIFVFSIFSLLAVSTAREHQLVVAERAAKEANLIECSRFAAEMLAFEIQTRWRFMEKRAADPKLNTYLTAAEQDAEASNAIPEKDSALNGWLRDSLYQEHYLSRRSSASWVAISSTGKILDRVPDRTESVGRAFCHRDYFHGQGHDLEPDRAQRMLEMGEIKPLANPHLSAVFRSTADDLFKVAFTVPVPWVDSGVMGPPRYLLMSSVALSNFTSLDQGDWTADRFAVLVKIKEQPVRVDNSEDSFVQVSGVVLHHPNLIGAVPDRDLVTLPQQYVNLMSEQSNIILRQKNARDAHKVSSKRLLIHDYVDPLTPNAVWNAAFFPVHIPSEDGTSTMNDTGFCVIVQERIR
ncbi:MAG: hypothetical protein AAFU85_16090, partial [Planctomycetota bacterium]